MPLVCKKEKSDDRQYSFLKRYVYSAILNTEQVLLCQIHKESLLYDFRLTAENAFSSHFLRAGSFLRCRVSEENLRSGLGGVIGSRSEEKQDRSTPFRCLTAQKGISNFPRPWTGSQWRFLTIGVMWHELICSLSTLAAVFGTSWRSLYSAAVTLLSAHFMLSEQNIYM